MSPKARPNLRQVGMLVADLLCHKTLFTMLLFFIKKRELQILARAFIKIIQPIKMLGATAILIVKFTLPLSKQVNTLTTDIRFVKIMLKISFIVLYHFNLKYIVRYLINLTSSFWLKSFKKPQAVWIYSFRFLKFLSQKYFVRFINFKVEMVLLSFLLFGCYDAKFLALKAADKKMPKSFANATKDQQEGWKYGCESGISAGGTHFHKALYRPNQINGYKFANSEEYRTAWNLAFNYCMYYHYHRAKINPFTPFTKGLIF